ncbi:MAG: LysM peptidoglycan-binding domain-containing protein [Verrucomicrobia bacterium]|nr:LysM peptidoglycan-binding domain-containing protein [Verrucomicrobiota bacterium]
MSPSRRPVLGLGLTLMLAFAGVCPDGFGGTYVVRRGDTLTEIAQRHNVAVSQLAEVNDMSLKEVIRPGQKLTIPETKPSRLPTHPEPERVVTVRKNESLALIARVNDIELQDLANANGIALSDSIYPGQRLKIPSGPVAASAPGLSPEVQRAIDRAPVRRGAWKYIVVHHSATSVGSAKGMDEYHRKQRHMENGLAYHFVIGNGRGMKDGEVFVGRRWTQQLRGGHLSVESLNEVSIGICLVGNYNSTRPTRRQIDNLEALLESLMKRCNLPASSIKTHSQIQPKHTECPGKRFDLNAVKRRLN